MLADAFGRTVTDIRVSVTKRCNFGCIYCHDEGLGPVLKPRMPHEDEMSVEEIERLLRIAREFGIRSVKFTGGEPLVRLDMEDIIDHAVRQIPDVSMTTNGSMLAKRAEGLRSAGLKRVNVSIDSLDPAAFREIRKGELAPVLRGIEEALRVGLKPVKLNMVVFKQTLPHIPAMIEHISHGDGLKLQLIQFMPELVGQQEWMVDIDSLKKWLELRADKVLVREMHHRRIYLFNGPRRRWAAGRLPEGRREPGAVLRRPREELPTPGFKDRGSHRIPRAAGGLRRGQNPEIALMDASSA